MADEVPDELLDQVLAVLGYSDGDDQPQLKRKLRAVAAEYLIHKSVADFYAFAKPQKIILEQLSAQADRLLATSRKVAPEYQAAVECAAGFSDPEETVSFPYSEWQADLKRMIDGVELFLAQFEPNQGPRANLPLQEAVLTLLTIVEAVGEDIHIARHKHSTGEPSVESHGATAIVTLLQGIDPKLPLTSIAEMIDKIRAGTISPDPIEPFIEFQTNLVMERALLLDEGPNRFRV